MTATLHDPGGKVRLSLPPDIGGNAAFSPCGRYRHMLSRSWGLEDGLTHGYALWIGMNPSTADAEVDDPTCRREVIYTRTRLKLSSYAKCNVMDYRATDPKTLLKLTAEERASGLNLRWITDLAKGAHTVIAAWGALPAELRGHALVVESALTRLDIKLNCVGFTKDGSPRHPLYVRRDAPLLPYPRQP